MVHVLAADVLSAPPADQGAVLAALPESIRRRIGALRDAADRLRSVGTYGLLLASARRIYGARPAAITADPTGKPCFSRDAGLLFNCSHRGVWGVCALARRVRGIEAVGIDIEEVHESPDYGPMDFVHPRERAWLASQGRMERATAFTLLWTLKESYAKAVGLGLQMDLDSFQVGFDERGVPRVVDGPDGPRAFLFALRDAIPGHAVSLCVLVSRHRRRRPSVRWYDANAWGAA